MTRQLKADLALLFVTFIWGSTFVLIKRAIQDIPPFSFLALRFLMAFLILSLIFYKKYRIFQIKTLYHGFMISIFMFAGYAFQTLGLQYTTASKSGFLSGLCVVMVPIFSALLYKKKPNTIVLLGVVLATAGLFMMTVDGASPINLGDILSFICAVSFAVYILQVDWYTVQSDSVLLTIMQVGMVGVWSSLFSVFFESRHYGSINFSPQVWLSLAITGVLATALAYLIQNVVQNFTTPSHTALIFAAEPVFSAIFAFFFAHEALSGKGLWGAAMIILGTLLPELTNFLSIGEKDIYQHPISAEDN